MTRYVNLDYYFRNMVLSRRIFAQGNFQSDFQGLVFFIPLAIFNIIEEILSWSGSQNINYDALIFADTVIHGVVGYFGYIFQGGQKSFVHNMAEM